MKHVINVEDGEAPVLRETGSGGLIGNGLLGEGALADHIADGDVPRYVVRNKKRGYRVEPTDDGGSVEEATPDRGHSAAAVVTDRRVLFAAGRGDGDRTRSVPLADIVDVRVDDGLLGGALVVETVDDRRYRFASRGDLEPVREFVDAAAGVWARAERHVETAADALDRMERAFESGDADVVLAAAGDVRETLRDAREEVASLSGAADVVASRVAEHRDRLTDLERRATAEQAEQARERGHTRWDDGEYEAAYDHFERAEERYAAAQSLDGSRPADDLIDRRRAQLTADCERLAEAPLAEAEHAFETATSADDIETAVEWWERALDRYETVRSLDWGREDRRFAGDREAVRERLTTVAERLVEARCERARRALSFADDAPPEPADAARERASDALDAAHDLARERVPDAVDTVERLRDRLESRGPRDAAVGETAAESVAGDSDDDSAVAGETVVVTDEAGNSLDTDPPEPSPSAESTDAAHASDCGDTTDQQWGLTDDESGDEWVSAERAATRVDPPPAADSGEVGARAASPGPDLPSLGADAFRAAVRECFEAAGWTTESVEADGHVDIRATTAGPLSLTAAVWTVAPDDAAALGTGAIERFATVVADDPALDIGVVAAGACLTDGARERVRTEKTRLVGPESLSAAFDRQGIDPFDGSDDA